MGEDPTGPPIWIVNADHWPRASRRAELIERGYDAIGFETLTEALATLLLPRARRPALLVLDLHGQVVTDASRALLLRERIPVLAVVDAAAPDDAPPGLPAGTLHRPLTIGAIAAAAAEAVTRSISSPADSAGTRSEPR